MNTKQLQYAIALSKSLNFSAVAEQLGISQPALSKQILHLENEIGVKLFDRSTNPLTITPAGERFFQEIQTLLFQKEQLLRSMEDFKTGKSGNLTIGISPFRSLYLIPNIAKQIKQEFPNIKIVLNEVGSEQLRKETAEGKYDFAIVNLPVDESVLDVIPIEADNLVLAIPKNLTNLLLNYSNPNEHHINFEDCKHLPFVVVRPNQEMRHLFDKSCNMAGFLPEIAMEVTGISTAWSMCREGIGATLLPRQFVEYMGSADNMTLYTLEQNLRSRQPVIITRKGQYISEYAKYAIKLLTK